MNRPQELYLYGFSEFENADLDEHGLFSYGDLDYYWFEPTHAAFIITVDDGLGGFALVSNEVALAENQRLLTEFFVMRKYRRCGVGRAVARLIFGRLRGRWEVHVIARNLPAQAFWRTVVAEYTGGAYCEQWWKDYAWEGVLLTFASPPAG